MKYWNVFIIILFTLIQSYANDSIPKTKISKTKGEITNSELDKQSFKIQNIQFDKSLIKRKIGKYQSLKKGVPIDLASLPYSTALPSSGYPKMLCILVEFNDFPHEFEASLINNKLFENGIYTQYPYESLRSYYIRSSYGNLHLEGNVLNWYTTQHDRAYYEELFQSEPDPSYRNAKSLLVILFQPLFSKCFGESDLPPLTSSFKVLIPWR